MPNATEWLKNNSLTTGGGTYFRDQPINTVICPDWMYERFEDTSANKAASVSTIFYFIVVT
jgi:hypothetical protein